MNKGKGTNRIEDYEHPFVTSDVCLLSVGDVYMGRRRGLGKELQVLLVKRSEGPCKGLWALPGGFVAKGMRIEDTARNKTFEKTGLKDFYIEQLYTFDTPDRDERGWIMSVAYMGLVDKATIKSEYKGSEETKWFWFNGDILTDVDGTGIDLEIDSLAFDHGEILKKAHERLAGKIDYTDVARYLLPEYFTIRDAQLTFKAVQGYQTDSFRRKLGNRVIETEEYQDDSYGRPAKLFKWNIGD